MGTGYLVAVFFNELVQALNNGIFPVISSEVKNLTCGAVSPGFNLDLNIGNFLGQGGGVFGDRQTDNHSPFVFRNKVGIRVAGTETADFEGRQSLLLEVKLQGVN